MVIFKDPSKFKYGIGSHRPISEQVESLNKMKMKKKSEKFFVWFFVRCPLLLPQFPMTWGKICKPNWIY